MRTIEIPAICLQGTVQAITEGAKWPYDDGLGDPFWVGGATPRPYQWVATIDVTTQTQSSYRTRQPYFFNARDIKVGDYIAEVTSGLTLKIMRIDNQGDNTITCLLEDTLRYNTLRDPSQNGIGIFSVPANVMIFEVNGEGVPILENLNGVSAAFYGTVMSRFENFDADYNFQLHQVAHGFELGDLIAADQTTHGFIKADDAHPYVVGTVSYVTMGPDDFMVTPLQKVIDSYNSLPGQIADVLYVDDSNPGEFSSTGSIPVLLKLRDFTNSVTFSTAMNANTTVGNQLKINGYTCTVGGTGAAQDLANAVNAITANTGVVASEVPSPTEAFTVPSNLAYGEPLIITGGSPVTATINGVLVTFSTTTNGLAQYGAGYAVEEDMAIDINNAAIPGITASTTSNVLTIQNDTGAPITIVNGQGDSSGTPFAGPNSISGVPLSTSASTGFFVRFEAIDARAISFFDVSGATTDDFGLISVENGVKAAGLYIEQGIRQAATYVVPNIPARDALTAMFGDQAYVQDNGNGEWAFYIYTLSNTWVKLADQDSSETDAQTAEVILTPTSNATGVIHTISDGRRVSFVTVTVDEAFGNAAFVTIGDDGDPARLMTADQSDLTVLGDYSATPSYTYQTGGQDTEIKYYLTANTSVSGNAVVAITYT